jgi:hypothetical protein
MVTWAFCVYVWGIVRRGVALCCWNFRMESVGSTNYEHSDYILTIKCIFEP